MVVWAKAGFVCCLQIGEWGQWEKLTENTRKIQKRACKFRIFLYNKYVTKDRGHKDALFFYDESLSNRLGDGQACLSARPDI